jgi:putative thiamine transport system permease protein
VILAARGLLLGLVLLPTAAGLLGVLLPAVGYLPALGFTEPSLAPMARVLALPGLGQAVLMSLGVGLASTAIALLLAIAITAGLDSRRVGRWLERLAAPLLAVPHLSIAVGAAFLLAPSGWLVRLMAGPLGVTSPPAIAFGAGYDLLVLGAVLVLKETPFLVAVLVAVARTVEDRRALALARSLGYGDIEARLKLLAPQWVARSRLAVMAVLVYGIGNVELALVLGPTAPPMLPVLILDLLAHPDLARRLDGSAAALLLILVTGLGYVAYRICAALLGVTFAAWLALGPTPGPTRWLARAADVATALLLAFLALTAIALALWSLAGPWRFPDPFPAILHIELWQRRAPLLLAHAGTTALIAATSAVLALAVVLFWLESTARATLPLWLWLPLLVPQIAFLFGLQVLMLSLGLRPGLVPVVLTHLLFVLPYTALLVADSWTHQDPRLAAIGRSLGHGRWSVFLRIKLPLLRAPLALALAIGMSVSVALYLPTLFASGGRVATLATEAVSLAQGGDRRLASATGMVLAVLPLLALVAARRFGR